MSNAADYRSPESSPPFDTTPLTTPKRLSAPPAFHLHTFHPLSAPCPHHPYAPAHQTTRCTFAGCMRTECVLERASTACIPEETVLTEADQIVFQDAGRSCKVCSRAYVHWCEKCSTRYCGVCYLEVGAWRDMGWVMPEGKGLGWHWGRRSRYRERKKGMPGGLGGKVD